MKPLEFADLLTRYAEVVRGIAAQRANLKEIPQEAIARMQRTTSIVEAEYGKLAADLSTMLDAWHTPRPGGDGAELLPPQGPASGSGGNVPNRPAPHPRRRRRS